MVKSSDRIIQFDYIRIIACLGVILLHSANYEGGKCENDDVIRNVYYSCSVFCVPLFVMLSGYFILDPAKVKISSIATFYKRRMNRILIPFIFWSLIGVLVWYLQDVILCKKDFAEYFHRMQVYFFHGALFYHLWYLGMTVGFYLAAPFLTECIGKCSKLQLACIIVYLFLGEWLSDYENYLLNRTGGAGFFLIMFIAYLPYFFAGKLFGSFFINIKNKVFWVLTFMLLLIISTIVIAYWNTNYSIISYLHPLCTIQTFLLFGLCLMFPPLKSTRLASIVFNLSFYSFGIYLVHGFVVLFIKKINLFSIFPVYLQVPSILIATLILSCILTVIISKIPYLKRTVI